jgi:hypothetical protein
MASHHRCSGLIDDIQEEEVGSLRIERSIDDIVLRSSDNPAGPAEGDPNAGARELA